MTQDRRDQDDGELARLSAVGDQQAFAALISRYRNDLYRIILNNVGDPDEALDILQESLFAAHRAIRRYDPTRSMRAWLTTIAINKCRDWARRRAVRRILFWTRPLDDVRDIIGDDQPGQEQLIADRQALAQLRHEVAKLPSSLKEPLILCAIEGLSHQEAAEMLSITPKAVETRLRRARILLIEVYPDGIVKQTR